MKVICKKTHHTDAWDVTFYSGVIYDDHDMIISHRGSPKIHMVFANDFGSSGYSTREFKKYFISLQEYRNRKIDEILAD